VRYIDHNSAVPLYAQLAECLRESIETESPDPGARFPGEIELAREHGVARVTVRRAISQLVEDGLLVRVQGKGTFIARPKIERELVDVASFTERMRAQGRRVNSRVVSIIEVPATKELCQHMQVSVGSPLSQITRVRSADGEPVAIETSYVSQELCPGIEKEDLAHSSLYQILKSKYGLVPGRSQKTLELAFAYENEARLLQITPGTPLFLMKALVSTPDGMVMEYAKLLLIGDRFRFQVF
jgi:GntR family transcriptional regulator